MEHLREDEKKNYNKKTKTLITLCMVALWPAKLYKEISMSILLSRSLLSCLCNVVFSFGIKYCTFGKFFLFFFRC